MGLFFTRPHPVYHWLSYSSHYSPSPALTFFYILTLSFLPVYRTRSTLLLFLSMTVRPVEEEERQWCGLKYVLQHTYVSFSFFLPFAFFFGRQVLVGMSVMMMQLLVSLLLLFTSIGVLFIYFCIEMSFWMSRWMYEWMDDDASLKQAGWLFGWLWPFGPWLFWPLVLPWFGRRFNWILHNKSSISLSYTRRAPETLLSRFFALLTKFLSSFFFRQFRRSW